MIRAAKIIFDKVENVMLVTATVAANYAAAGIELLDADPLDLAIGDYRREGVWYRMVDGQEMALPLPAETGPSYDELLAYYNATKEALEE